jgi:ABC-type multidrug transport system fused ATPase/permease subunit
MVNQQLLARVWRDTRMGLDGQAARSLAKAGAVVLMSTFLLNFAPIFVARLIDTTMAAAEEGGRLMLYAALYLLCRFAGQVLADLRWITVNPVIYQLSYRQCADIAARLAGAKAPQAGARRSAATIAEQAAVIGKMNLSLVGMLYSVVVVIFPALVEFVVVLGVVAYLVGAIAAAYVGIGLLIFLMSVGFMKRRELAETEQAFSHDNLVAGYYGEYLSNTALINEFSAADFFRARLWANIERSMDAHLVLFGTKAKRGMAVSVATGIAYSAVILWAVVNAREGLMTAGQFFLVIFYLDRVVQPMAAVSAAVGGLQSSLVAMGIGYACLDEQLRGAGREDHSIRPVAASVALSEDTIFALAEGKLRLGAPGVVFLAGASGAGKSTCLRWLHGKLNAQGAAVHYLTADPLLVSGSVLDNIGLGATHLDRAAIDAVWRHWHETFGNRSIALDEPVDLLSAGERQFVAICRSMLRHPPILILDEATNSIDATSERRVMAMLKQHLPQSSLLVVSHREMAIPADVVATFRRGALLEIAAQAPA